MKSNLGQVVTSHGHCQTRNFIIQIDHLSICCILDKSSMGLFSSVTIKALCGGQRGRRGFRVLCLEKGLWISLSHQGSKRSFERDLGCCDSLRYRVTCSPSPEKKVSGHQTAKTRRHGLSLMKAEMSATPTMTIKDLANASMVSSLQRKEGLNLRAGGDDSVEPPASLPPQKSQVLSARW